MWMHNRVAVRKGLKLKCVSACWKHVKTLTAGTVAT